MEATSLAHVASALKCDWRVAKHYLKLLHLPTFLWGGLLLPYTPLIVVNFFKVYVWVLIGLVSMFSNFLLPITPTRRNYLGGIRKSTMKHRRKSGLKSSPFHYEGVVYT